MEVSMKKLVGVLTGFAAIVMLCTFIVAQEGGVDVPEPKQPENAGIPKDVKEPLERLIKLAAEKLAELGKKKLSEADLDSVLKETLAAIDALTKLKDTIKDPAMKDMINQLIKELRDVKEIVELTKREYNWGDVYGCPNYNKRRVDDSLRKIDEIMKKTK
jgi:hypothetical protein